MNYPEHRPRKLRRSRSNRWIGGVCGGIADYLNVDATLVRVAVVIIAVVTTVVPVAAIYLLMMLLLPEADNQRPGSIGPAQRFPWQQGSQGHSDSVWGQAGPPWRPSRDPNIDTSAPQPPRQSAEDLFSRAKRPTDPTTPPANQSSPQSSTDDNDD